MKFSSVLFLAIAGVATAKHGKEHVKHGFQKAVCYEIQSLNHLNSMVANKTALDKATNNDAAKAEKLKQKAQKESQRLQKFMGNSTTMVKCNQMFAFQHMQSDCRTMHSIQHLQKIANNQTLLDKHAHGNGSRAAALKAQAAAKNGQLQSLQSNQTLTAFCSVEDTKATCAHMARMKKEVALAKDAKKLASKFGNNANKTSAFQAHASKAAAKLDELNKNATLVNACKTYASKFFPILPAFSLCTSFPGQ